MGLRGKASGRSEFVQWWGPWAEVPRLPPGPPQERGWNWVLDLWLWVLREAQIARSEGHFCKSLRGISSHRVASVDEKPGGKKAMQAKEGFSLNENTFLSQIIQRSCSCVYNFVLTLWTASASERQPSRERTQEKLLWEDGQQVGSSKPLLALISDTPILVCMRVTCHGEGDCLPSVLKS